MIAAAARHVVIYSVCVCFSLLFPWMFNLLTSGEAIEFPCCVHLVLKNAYVFPLSTL